jgi:hypothetical protein
MEGNPTFLPRPAWQLPTSDDAVKQLVAMWTLGHSVREVERSSNQVVVTESATVGAAGIFGAFAVLSFIVYRSRAGAVLTLFFASVATYAAVNSDFVADRNCGELVVRRRVGPWAIRRAYQARTIDQIYVRRSFHKGSGLAVRFKSGRSKNLTMSLGWTPDLDRIAATLNHFLHTPHR